MAPASESPVWLLLLSPFAHHERAQAQLGLGCTVQMRVRTIECGRSQLATSLVQGGALTVCPRGCASKARLRLQIRAGSQAPPGAGGAPRSGATMSTRPGTLRHSRTPRSARHSPRNEPVETRTAVVARPASVKRLRAHPTGAKGAAPREAATAAAATPGRSRSGD
jgi:hypothetical protein